MTTTTPTDRPATPASTGGRGVSFGGILRSEWIKLRSLRSTLWCAVIILALSLAIAGLYAGVIDLSTGPGSTRAAAGVIASAATVPSGFTVLIAAVLGSLMITGEYGTGMIRSTFAAIPARVPALLGKAVVVLAAMLVIAAVSTLAAAGTAAAILAGRGLDIDLGDGALWASLLGAALYLGGIATFALFVGAVVRNSAGGIAISLAVILVLPTVLQILTGITKATWAADVAEVLPSNAGARMSQYLPAGTPTAATFDDRLVLTPVEGGLVLLAWVVVLGVLAAVLIRRRDV